MKKYIITTEQLQAICGSACAAGLVAQNLKPIEPLTPIEVKELVKVYPSEDLCGWSYRMGIADAERHIIGSETS